MKITIYHEDKNNPVILEVPDEECAIWVEEDYQRRLSQAAPEDIPEILRRSAQEIMEKDYNKPNFNNHHKETRRHVSLEAMNQDGNLIPATSDVESEIFKEDYEALYRAISRLKPAQQELLRKVYWQERTQRSVAAEMGSGEDSVSKKLSRIYKKLERYLSEKREIDL